MSLFLYKTSIPNFTPSITTSFKIDIGDGRGVEEPVEETVEETGPEPPADFPALPEEPAINALVPLSNNNADAHTIACKIELGRVPESLPACAASRNLSLTPATFDSSRMAAVAVNKTLVVKGKVVETGSHEEKKEEEVMRPAHARARAAAQYGRLKELEEMLMSGEYNVNERDDEGCTLLQWAAINNRGPVLEMLLGKGADPKASGGILDENALQWAVRQGHVAAIVTLRESGAEAGHKGVEGGNAVHLACRYGRHLALAYLLARDEVCASTKTFFDRERSLGLLDLPDDRGRTPLMVCVEWYWSGASGNLDALRILLAFGASVNFACESSKRSTALHLAAERGLEAAALLALVDAGAVLDAEDGEGRTPEMVARQSGNVRTAVLLRSLRSRDVCELIAKNPLTACVTRSLSRCVPQRRNASPSSGSGTSDDENKTPTANSSSGSMMMLTIGGGGSAAPSPGFKPVDELNGEKTVPNGDDDTESAELLGGGKSRRRRTQPLCLPMLKCDAQLGLAAFYGLVAPLLVVLGFVTIAETYGWIAAVAPIPLLPFLLTALAPKKASRYGMCGFAAVSIVTIVASFFVFGFHERTSPFIVGLYVTFVGALAVNFVLAVITDPGIVDAPRDVKIKRLVHLARSGKLPDANLCATCLVEKPPRAKHDPTLGKCVRRFDHWCPYIANVVGERNYLFFYLFLAFVVLAIALHLILVAPNVAAIDCPPVPHHRGKERGLFILRRPSPAAIAAARRTDVICLQDPRNALLAIATPLAFIHLLWVFALFAVHTNLICSDQTTYESMRSHHHPHTSKAILLQPHERTSCCAKGLRNARNALCAPVPPDDLDTNGPELV